MVTEMRTRATRTIALPAELLPEVDRVARHLGQSRSRYITQVLRCSVRARRHAAITRRLEELFTDPRLADEQRRIAAPLDAAGSNWKTSDEDLQDAPARWMRPASAPTCRQYARRS